jgi:rubredoxin
MYQYVCLDCGWIYDEALGLPERGILPGTPWAQIPDDFVCPNCSVKKSDTHLWQQI